MSNRGVNLSMAVPFTPVVKWLLIINVFIWFVFQVLMEGFLHIQFTSIFSLVPEKVLYDFSVWQLGTYMFLHSMQVTHILFNMLMLWFFGAELEQRWGSKFFLFYYLFCGIGAAVIYCLGIWGYVLATSAPQVLRIPVIGASGAIFGLMLAHGILFGERIVYFFMLFPMKTKYFVMIMGFVQIASMMTSSSSGGEVAYLAHLGGLVAGYLCLQFRGTLLRFQTNQRARQKKGRNLRLVVDNEKDSQKGPKYWN
jgi:membrane associated rhomboid family serine protease